MWLIVSGHKCGVSTGQQVLATLKIAVTREEDCSTLSRQQQTCTAQLTNCDLFERSVSSLQL